jgi:hypothetical protein
VVSIYSSVIAPSGWLQLDNVQLRTRPALNVIGTECYEPAAGEASPELIPTLEPTATPLMVEPSLLTTNVPLESQSAIGEGQWVEPELESGGGE